MMVSGSAVHPLPPHKERNAQVFRGVKKKKPERVASIAKSPQFNREIVKGEHWNVAVAFDMSMVGDRLCDKANLEL